MAFNCCIIGTDTEVGKTHILALLCHGLRLLQRDVWVHKPIACGDWQDGQAEDARRLRQFAHPQQPPESICPLEFPAAASPHLAAQEAGVETAWRDMSARISALHGEHDLLVESAGGILAPLSTDRGTIIDICLSTKLPALLVTRPHLGTLNHTQLSVREAQRHGIPLLGMVINYHEAGIDTKSLAVRTAKDELEQLCGLPVLAEIPYTAQGSNNESAAYNQLAQTLAERLLCIHAES